MPRRGKGTPEEEALDFAERMTRDWEDLDVLTDEDIWLKHVKVTIFGDPMAEPTENQIRFYQFAREYAMETRGIVGATAEVVTYGGGGFRNVYRDVSTGRFISRQTFLEMQRGRTTRL